MRVAQLESLAMCFHGPNISTVRAYSEVAEWATTLALRRMHAPHGRDKCKTVRATP
jgi:hypothetical protein